MKILSRRIVLRSLTLLIGLGATPFAFAASQTLETETVRLLPAKGIKFGGNFERQTSSEGRETAVPMFFEVGLSDRTELVIEPVAYAGVRPKVGPRATGVGDLEITLVERVFAETPSRPAIALAGEVKVPLARNQLLGTGKTDFAGYFIASKRFGRLDTHANIGYTVVGRPVGVKLRNIGNFAVAAMLDVGSRIKLYSEILANTSATTQGESSSTPEVSGGELVGTLGVARQVNRGVTLTMGLSYDNNGAVLFRPGITVRLF